MTAGQPLNQTRLPIPRGQEITSPSIKATADRVATAEQQIATLSTTKANASTVGGLATAVASKASASDLTALAAKVPAPAVATPLAEKVGASTGTEKARYALEDHQHPRLTSTTYATLGPNGQATVAFSRTFVNKPGLNLTETDATANTQPLVMRGLSWVRDANGLYIGVVIQGQRARMMPTINPLSGTLTLLSAVLTGVNAVFAQLTNYNIFGGDASGATVSVIAIARSDVPAT